LLGLVVAIPLHNFVSESFATATDKIAIGG
jgi:hypothetical protein